MMEDLDGCINDLETGMDFLLCSVSCLIVCNVHFYVIIMKWHTAFSTLELASVEAMIMGDHLDAPQTRPALKAKEEGKFTSIL